MYGRSRIIVSNKEDCICKIEVSDLIKYGVEEVSSSLGILFLIDDLKYSFEKWLEEMQSELGLAEFISEMYNKESDNKKEFNIFNIGKKYNVFPNMGLFTLDDKINALVAEEAKLIKQEGGEISEEIATILKETNDKLIELGSDIITDDLAYPLIEEVGEDNFKTFLENSLNLAADVCIYDIHEDNIGIMPDNRIVYIDLGDFEVRGDNCEKQKEKTV